MSQTWSSVVSNNIKWKLENNQVISSIEKALNLFKIIYMLLKKKKMKINFVKTKKEMYVCSMSQKVQIRMKKLIIKVD